MKSHILAAVTLLLMTAAGYAQDDVTTFLGIPVDGTKAGMIYKLKAKGFTYDSTYDWLEGEFNGWDVNISVVTDNNKVWRIMVRDKYTLNETDIKIRFNTLCQQFERNQRYMNFSDLGISQLLPEEDDIDYEISHNDKRYEAVYFQGDDASFKAAMKEAESKTDDDATPDELTAFLMRHSDTMIQLAISVVYKKVWFMIDRESYDRYRILMYYDNEYNRANGEDL